MTTASLPRQRLRRRAVVYIRVSKGRENMISPDIQLDATEAWAKRNNTDIVKVIKDLDKSGRRFEKRAVAQIIREIQEDEYDTVILWKWSRWGRNAVKSGVYLAQVEEANGRVVSATEDVDVATALGRFTRSQLLALAELESDMRSDGWKEAQQQRRKANLPHTAQPRFGYTYVRDALGHRYEPDPLTTPILVDLYQRYVKGTSLYALAHDLNARGIKTLLGNDWSVSALTIVMDSGFAAGFLRERSKPDPRKTKTRDSFDIWREGAHKAIISRDLWDGYQRRRDSNSRKPARLIRVTHSLSGLVYCGICGTRMVAGRSTGDPRYKNDPRYKTWRCKKKADKGQAVCPGVMLSLMRTEKSVLDWCAEQAEGEWDLARAAALATREKIVGDVEKIKAKIVDLDQQRSRLVKLYMRNGLDDRQYDEERAHLDSETKLAEAALAEASEMSEATPSDPKEALTAISESWDSLVAEAEKNRLLTQVIDRVLIFPGKWGPGKVQVIPRWEP